MATSGLSVLQQYFGSAPTNTLSSSVASYVSSTPTPAIAPAPAPTPSIVPVIAGPTTPTPTPVPTVPLTPDLAATYNATIQGAQQALVQIQTTYADYSTALSTNTDILSQQSDIQKQIEEKTLILNELNRVEGTYDRDYLDRRVTGPVKSFFGKMGLSSTQDWALAFFFAAFITMVAVILILLLINSTQKLRLGIFTLLVAGAFNFVFALLIRFYG